MTQQHQYSAAITKLDFHLIKGIPGKHQSQACTQLQMYKLIDRYTESVTPALLQCVISTQCAVTCLPYLKLVLVINTLALRWGT